MSECIQLIAAIFFAILVRWCISLNKYSGAGTPPMFGDYEAQRHWMEITYNLPIQQWYKNSSDNNLLYWGLDYPPLTAYHSWLCGYVANKWNPDWVALHKSRGLESYQHKLFMRYTVLVADLLVYFPAVIFFFCSRTLTLDTQKIKAILLMLLYPGLMLVDHGHFQYNCVSLGLAMLAVAFISRGRDLLASIAFCLALMYKQMELYHAAPFFCYLLGSCIRSTNQNGLVRLISIGVVVVSTMGACVWPFLSDVDTALQVLHRVFPFARGLYEDKVANVWCSVSVLVKLKELLSLDQLVKLCLGSTLVALLPSSIDLLLTPSVAKFKIALINSSLAFFLFSFHVHEKSIIIPALAVCLLLQEKPFWCLWFLVISTFSMLPLLIKDGLIVPSITTVTLHVILAFCFLPILDRDIGSLTKSWVQSALKVLFALSLLGAAVLTIVSLTIRPPKHLPDLWPLLVSVYSSGHFVMFFIYFHIAQFTCRPLDQSNVHINTGRHQFKSKRQ